MDLIRIPLLIIVTTPFLDMRCTKYLPLLWNLRKPEESSLRGSYTLRFAAMLSVLWAGLNLNLFKNTLKIVLKLKKLHPLVAWNV